MKITPKLSLRANAGYALLMVLIMSAASLLILAATMNRTSTVVSQNGRNNQFNTTLNAAEAATERVIARMRADYLYGGDAAIANNLSIYRTNVPTVGESSFWGSYEFTDAQGGVSRTYVQVISNRTYVPLQSQYAGLSGWSTVYRVISNAKQVTGLYNIPVAVQQDVELDSIPVFQFAIFYNGLLEFTWAAPLTVRGRTHANGNIYVGSASDLKFKDIVTTAGIISKRSWGGFSLGSMDGSITYTGTPGYSTNVPVLSLPVSTNNTADAVREIIVIPPSGENPESPLGVQRYYNKAGMVLLISDTVVTAIIKNSPTDPSPVTITSSNSPAEVLTNFPFLDLTVSFTDQRENKTIKTTQIDMEKFSTWAGANTYTSPTGASTKHPSSNPLNILFVADNRTTTAVELTAVRLTDGVTIPGSPGTTGQLTGFTVATPNPLYVLGDYNCPTSAHLNTTNTTATAPASLISDALTILSKNWLDSQSASSFTIRDAANTTVNAAIITGTVYSAGSTGTAPFSGGVMNLPRLLEDWGNGSRTLTLNTSIVNLFNSARAIAPFQNPGYYYYAPTREFNFDQNFRVLARLPPGTPVLGLIMRAKWSNPPANVTTYAGP